MAVDRIDARRDSLIVVHFVVDVVELSSLFETTVPVRLLAIRAYAGCSIEFATSRRTLYVPPLLVIPWLTAESANYRCQDERNCAFSELSLNTEFLRRPLIVQIANEWTLYGSAVDLRYGLIILKSASTRALLRLQHMVLPTFFYLLTQRSDRMTHFSPAVTSLPSCCDLSLTRHGDSILTISN